MSKIAHALCPLCYTPLYKMGELIPMATCASCGLRVKPLWRKIGEPPFIPLGIYATEAPELLLFLELAGFQFNRHNHNLFLFGTDGVTIGRLTLVPSFDDHVQILIVDNTQTKYLRGLDGREARGYLVSVLRDKEYKETRIVGFFKGILEDINHETAK